MKILKIQKFFNKLAISIDNLNTEAEEWPQNLIWTNWIFRSSRR
jgi:hypothetical protein